MIKKKISVIWQLLPYVWTSDESIHRRYIGTLFFIFFTSILNIFIPLTLRKAIDYLSLEEAGSLAITYILSYCLLWGISKISDQLREIITFRAIQRSITQFSLVLFKHLHNLSLDFHLACQTGGITTLIERAQTGMINVFWGVGFNLIPTTLEIIAAAIILWKLYGVFYGIGLVATLIIYAASSVFLTQYAVKAQRKANAKNALANAYIVDSLLNYETVKYFNNQSYEYNRGYSLLSEREDAETKMAVYLETITLVQSLIITFGLLVLMIAAGKSVLKEELKVSDFVLINGYFLQFAIPLRYAGLIVRNFRRGITNMEQAIDLLNTPASVEDISGATDILIENAEVFFDKVSFSFDKRRPIIKDLSFKILPGKTTAIVGATGSGKSTISKLLFRLYDIKKGKISIDSQDISKISLESLQKIIAIVPQDVSLFNNTLYYNIHYGNFTASKADVEEVIMMAGLTELIKKLPDGLETQVGERGLKLSGGEKQRVGIARALLKKPAIFIFDEATSSLDTRTEQEIQKNIERISQKVTTLIISHRLSTVVRANEILVLREGEIIERGTHEQLLENGGEYGKLWEAQQKE